MSNSNRRAFIRGGALAAAAGGAAKAQSGPEKKVYYMGEKPKTPVGEKPKVPLFSGAVSYGNLLFISGIGAHFPGDIKAHTAHVLDEIQKVLANAGSSMEKVLKCNVYLNDIKDWKAMNEVFQGRFGENPPVRTTIAAAGGIPGDSLVEMDVIAYI
jgi:2-iminobutanoate/2-iminopropanoate deaminase